jgi:hypothetical protein
MKQHFNEEGRLVSKHFNRAPKRWFLTDSRVVRRHLPADRYDRVIRLKMKNKEYTGGVEHLTVDVQLLVSNTKIFHTVRRNLND